VGVRALALKLNCISSDREKGLMRAVFAMFVYILVNCPQVSASSDYMALVGPIKGFQVDALAAIGSGEHTALFKNYFWQSQGLGIPNDSISEILNMRDSGDLP
jgi:hypothetical protein